MIKIFHCGDIHLDSAFSGISPSESARRRKELLERFSQMIRFADDSRVDLILISGDLFDSKLVQPNTVSRLVSLFESVKCRIIITPGNHDPYSDDSVYMNTKFSDNVYVYKTEQLTRVDLNDIGVSVFGYAFTSNSYNSKPLAPFKPEHLSKDNVNVLCAHTDIYNPMSTYAPISAAELSESGFDYAALGHVHKTPEKIMFENTCAAYSGFLEGRGFDECGEGGAWIVNIDTSAIPSKTTLERVCVLKSKYAQRNVDITGADSDSVALSMIERALFDDPGIVSGGSLRLVLNGELPISYSPSVAVLKKIVTPAGYIEIEDNTSPVYDTEYLLKDVSVKGEFYRMMLPMLSQGSDQERKTAALALRYGLCALMGQDIVLE